MYSASRPPSLRAEIAITLFGLIGLALFLALYDQAFPSAAIDLTLSRDQITQRAEAYLRSRGFDVQGYEFALTFQESGWSSIYLQRTLGVADTNRVVRERQLPIWFWQARWYRPLQKEEFSLSMLPDGAMIGLDHSLPEDAPGTALTQDAARALAEDYLARDRGWTLAGWESVAASSQERPGGRVDHHFEWKRRDFVVGESELRLSIDVQGDRIDGYDYWLKVPETFQRQFSEQSNRAAFFGGLSTLVGVYGFLIIAFVACLVAMWRGVIAWNAGLKPALVIALVSLLAGLNSLSLYKAGYGTTQDYTLFWLQRIFNVAYSAGYSAVVIFVLWPGGQVLGKQVWPRQDKILPRSGDRWRTLSRSTWRGLMLGGLWGGYTVLFYLIATRLFGGWVPLDTPSSSLFATPFPFLAPLEVGLLPATEEELLFRLVGIAVVLRLTHRRWLALLIPGALWAFAHLTYVRDPFYLRGIELTIHAVLLAGLFFLRFDLTTTIMAHFAYNAGLTALPLLRSADPFFAVSGWIVVAAMLAPIAPGVWRALRRRARGERLHTPDWRIEPLAHADEVSGLPVEGAKWIGQPDAIALILRDADRVVGMIGGRLTADDAAAIEAVYVEPKWRRLYAGSALVDALAAHLRERGAARVRVEVEASDTIGTAFWARQGWQIEWRVMGQSLAPGAATRRRWPWSRIRSRS